MSAPVPSSLRAAIEARVARHPDRLALRCGSVRQTFAELNASIDRGAMAVRELGAGPGCRVGLMLTNSPEMVWLWLALAKLGAVMVPINTRLRGDSLRYLLDHAKPDVAVVGEESLEAFREACPLGRESLQVVPTGPRVDGRRDTYPRLSDLLAAAPAGPPPWVDLPPDGLAAVMFTSGTTGRPKGVLIPRQAQLRHGLNYTELLGIEEEETAYAFLPLFHVTAMGTTLGALLGGGNVAIDSGFTPFGFWERTRQYDAKIFTFVGSVVSLLYNRPHRPDDRANPVRRVIGAATPPGTWRAFEERFGVEIVETYGQTEFMGLWFMPPPEGPRVGTVGKPPDGRFEAKIAEADGGELPPGARGEIAIRPRDRLDMAVGYLDDPATTAAAYRDDGWYYTGDIGSTDSDGYYRYVGRFKDCIRRRGENIAAFEIEQVVNGHPKVLESAAVGVPSPLGEEEVKLCVVPRPDEALVPREILSFCRERLADFMVPRFIQLRGSLPKTATERVQKAQLRDEGTADCWQATGRRG